MNPNVLDYSRPATRHRPKRPWLPVGLLLLATGEWYGARLTPPGFPIMMDWAMLGVLLLGAIVMGYFTSLPGWVYSGFGGLGTLLFLLANFTDNNFMHKKDELLIPWCLITVSGSVAAYLAGWLGRAMGRRCFPSRVP